MSTRDCITCIHRENCYDYIFCYWALHYPRPNAEKCEDYIYDEGDGEYEYNEFN